MKRLADVVPDFAAEVASALEREGYPQLRGQVLNALIERWTFDSSVNAGYIYLVQAKPLHQSETPAGLTVAIAAPHWFNVDLRGDGDIFGIELLGRSEVIGSLEAAGAP